MASPVDRLAEIRQRQRAYHAGAESCDRLEYGAAVVLAPQLVEEGDAAVWGLVIDPPSTGKTADIDTVSTYSGVHVIHSLTQAGVAGAYRDRKGKKVPSLVELVDQKCLVFPDMSAFFNGEDRIVRKVIGDLTAAYDGTFNQQSGTWGYTPNKGHFGFLGATTPLDIAQHERLFSRLGPRFLFYRPQSLSPEERAAARAAAKAPDRSAQRRALQDLMREHLEDAAGTLRSLRAAGKPVYAPESASISETIEGLAMLVATCRSLIVDDEVQTEGSTRAFQQLLTLGRTLARLRNRDAIGAEEIGLLYRVALGSMPARRHAVMRYVAAHPDEPLTLEAWVQASGRGKDAADKDLRDLVQIGALSTERIVGSAHALRYMLAEPFRPLFPAPSGEALAA